MKRAFDCPVCSAAIEDVGAQFYRCVECRAIIGRIDPETGEVLDPPKMLGRQGVKRAAALVLAGLAALLVGICSPGCSAADLASIKAGAGIACAGCRLACGIVDTVTSGGETPTELTPAVPDGYGQE